MKRFLLFFLLLFALADSSMSGQTRHAVTPNNQVATNTALSRLKSLNQSLRSSERMPEFPGGDKALMEFLRQHIVYPETAAKFGVQGKVVVIFVVNKDGSISDIKIHQSVDKELDEEAVRVVKMLPKFKPAIVDGKPVEVWYTLPVTFTLPSSMISLDDGIN